MVPGPLPLAGPKAMPRLALSVKPLLAESVPRLSTMLPAVAAAGARPRSPSAETLSVPPLLTIVPPLYVLPALPSTSVPGPAMLRIVGEAPLATCAPMVSLVAVPLTVTLVLVPVKARGMVEPLTAVVVPPVSAVMALKPALPLAGPLRPSTTLAGRSRLPSA